MQRVNVYAVDLQDFRVVCDCLMVVSKLGEAVSSVIECFHIVLSSKLDFVGVVINSGFKAF